MWLCWCRQRFYKKFRRCHWSDMGVGRVVGPCGICPISEAGFNARRSQITHNYRCRHSPARNSKGAATNRSHLRDQRYQHNHDATSKLAAAQQDEPSSKEHEILGSHYRLPLFRFSSTTAHRSHHAVLHYPSSTPKTPLPKSCFFVECHRAFALFFVWGIACHVMVPQMATLFIIVNLPFLV